MDTEFEEIVDIEYLGELETFDLEIDSDDHNYYANGICVSNSHATCYSYLAMQTLYLKHYYPTEFYTALLNHPKSNTDKEKEKQWIQSAILAAIAKGIEIVPPNRKSNWEWTMVGEKTIAMGFSGINGMGEVAYQELIDKNFKNLSKDDFFAKKFSKFNKGSFEACLKAGIFDDWSNSREEILEWRKRKVIQVFQVDIFGEVGVQKYTSHKKFKATTEEEKQKEFMEVCSLDLILIRKLGDLKKQWYDAYQTDIEPVTNFENPKDFYYFYLVKIEEKSTKTGKKFYTMHLSDGGTVKKVNMWSNLYDRHKSIIKTNSAYITKFTQEGQWLSFDGTAEFRKIF